METERLNEANEPQPSKLAMGHLLDWADGVTSSAKLWKHMDNALQDGITLPMIQRLASIGSGGSRHASQNMFNLLEKCGVQGLLTILVDSHTTHVLLPSTWIRLLHRDYPTNSNCAWGQTPLC